MVRSTKKKSKSTSKTSTVTSSKKYFIGIKNHPIIRHRTLTSLRSIIYILKSYEELKDIRREKINKIKQLQDVILGLSDKLKGLRSSLPEVEDKYKPSRSSSIPVEVSKKEEAKKDANISKKYSRVYELEQQLRDLEKRINTIDVK